MDDIDAELEERMLYEAWGNGISTLLTPPYRQPSWRRPPSLHPHDLFPARLFLEQFSISAAFTLAPDAPAFSSQLACVSLQYRWWFVSHWRT